MSSAILNNKYHYLSFILNFLNNINGINYIPKF